MVVRYIPPKLKKEQLREEEMKMHRRVNSLKRRNYIYFPIDYIDHYYSWLRQCDIKMLKKLSNYRNITYTEEVTPDNPPKIKIHWHFKKSGGLNVTSACFNAQGAVLNPRKKERAKTSAQLLVYLRRNPKIKFMPTTYLRALPPYRFGKNGTRKEEIKFHVDRLDKKDPAKIFILTKSFANKPLPLTKRTYKELYHRDLQVSYKELTDTLLNRLRTISRLKQYNLHEICKMNPRKRKSIWKPVTKKNLSLLYGKSI